MIWRKHPILEPPTDEEIVELDEATLVEIHAIYHEAIENAERDPYRFGFRLPHWETPFSPPSGPAQWLFQEPPAKSKFLAAPSSRLAVNFPQWRQNNPAPLFHLEQKAAGGQIFGSSASITPIPEHAQLTGQPASTPVGMLGDPAAEPAHFFLTHFTSLNFDRPLHDPSLLSNRIVVQLFLQLSEMRP
jgi:hypothetical protein